MKIKINESYEDSEVITVVNENNGEDGWIVTLGTGTAWTKSFMAYARHEQEALDLVIDYLEDNELDYLYMDYYEIADLADTGETADEYADANGIVCGGNSGLYVQLVNIERV